jgi:hypothetical protein
LFQASDSMQFLSTMSSSQPKKGSQYLDRHWKVDTNVLLILPPVKNKKNPKRFFDFFVLSGWKKKKRNWNKRMFRFSISGMEP